MHPKKLIRLIEGGETTHIEFKRKTPSLEKIAKEITALANTSGGYLLIGVDDDRTLYGVESEKAEVDNVERACLGYIEPPVEPGIEIVSIYGFDIIVVQIPESRTKPHYASVKIKPGDKKNRKMIYIRSGDESVLASSGMARLLKDTYNTDVKVKMNFGDREQRLFDYLKTNKNITAKQYAKLVNISARRAERMLISLVRIGILQITTDNRRDYYSALDIDKIV